MRGGRERPQEALGQRAEPERCICQMWRAREVCESWSGRQVVSVLKWEMEEVEGGRRKGRRAEAAKAPQ